LLRSIETTSSSATYIRTLLLLPCLPSAVHLRRRIHPCKPTFCPLIATQHNLISSHLYSRSAPLKQQITTHAHPLDPLVASEIVATSQAVRRYSDALQVPLERLLFNSITLREPPKLSVLKWAGTVQDPEVLSADSEIKRQAEVSIPADQPVVRWLKVQYPTRSIAWMLQPPEPSSALSISQQIYPLPGHLPRRLWLLSLHGPRCPALLSHRCKLRSCSGRRISADRTRRSLPL
jgi:hypothetical protein